MDFDTTQREAIELCVDMSKRLVGVTGPAGTGKTTIMQQVYQRLHFADANGDSNIALCAPTGKAAKRIQEATGIQAMTIHRLLEYPHPGERDPKTGKVLKTTDPKRCRYNPLPYRIVLADEYAMVNQELHRNLVAALPPGGVLRCFGDINQLPPIERADYLKEQPSPFEDILARFPKVTLNTIHRQGEGSTIVAAANLINLGRVPSRSEDFNVILTDQPQNALRTLIVDREHSNLSFRTTDMQILTPTNRTWVGTAELNTLIQDFYNSGRELTDRAYKPERHNWDKKPIWFDVGEKVIVMQNDYNFEVFNGETGIIKEIGEYQEVLIDFGDREVTIPPVAEYIDKHGDTRMYNPQKDLALAYAITTHKAQGSEFKEIVYMLNKSSMFMQSRKNFYTAVTRARQRVTVITDSRSLSTSVWKTEKRNGSR